MIWNPPDEIKKLAEVWEPYEREIVEGKLDDVPKEAIEAYKKRKGMGLGTRPIIQPTERPVV